MKTLILAAVLAVIGTAAQAQPRHIYRDGQYFFCPYPEFDPYCMMPNDYSVPLYPRPSFYGPPQSRPGPPVLLAPPGLAAEANRAINNALRPRYRKPPDPPRITMEAEREAIIRQGEDHCRRFPQDTQVCHPPKK